MVFDSDDSINELAILLYKAVCNDMTFLLKLFKDNGIEIVITEKINNNLIDELFTCHIATFIIAVNSLYKGESLAKKIVEKFIDNIYLKYNNNYDKDTYLCIIKDIYPYTSVVEISDVTTVLSTRICNILDCNGPLDKIVVDTYCLSTVTTTCEYYIQSIRNYKKRNNGKIQRLLSKFFIK